MKLDNYYSLEYSDYRPHLCYTPNVSTEMFFALLKMLLVELRTTVSTQNLEPLGLTVPILSEFLGFINLMSPSHFHLFKFLFFYRAFLINGSHIVFISILDLLNRSL